MPPQHIAILGGGLTGLSSAFYLSRRFPGALITLLEKKNRLGGWVRSEQVSLVNDGDLHSTSNPLALTVEAGPRTLRPNSKCVLELVNLLNLQQELLTTPRTAPAAQSRFLYDPSLHSKIIALPTSLFAFLRSPLRKILLPAIFREPLRTSNRPSSQMDACDESFDSFLHRRFGSDVARVLGSALCHGVYAADARELSVRAAFPVLYDLETRGHGSVILGMLKGILGFKDRNKGKQGGEYDMGDVPDLMRGVAVYSFRGGVQTLSGALVKALLVQPNVKLCTEEGIDRIEMQGDQESSLLKIHTPKRSFEPSHIVSALPLPQLQSVLPPSSHAHRLPHLTANSSSSVTVLSLIFATPSYNIHPPGFGYLVPRPLEGYPSSSDVETSKLGVLGTVFDSCALPATSTGEEKYTKLTVMLGGPYTIPLPTDDNVLLTRVLAHLSNVLQCPLPQPVKWRVWRHIGCIPTLRVGHVERMKELRKVLEEKEGKGAWRGLMEVVGAGVGGVSVGDCLEAGRRVGAHW